MLELLLFYMDHHQFAIPTSRVSRITLVTAVIPLPEAPSFVAGVINVSGRYIPVIHMRSRFGLDRKPATLEEYFIIVRMAGRPVALWVDKVGEIREIDDEAVTSRVCNETLWPQVQGVTEIDDETILIYDLEACLTPEEGARLDGALGRLNKKEGLS